MDVSSLIEEQQIAIALQMSMQCPEIEDEASTMPIATTADIALSSPLPVHSDQVFITFLRNPRSFSIFIIFNFVIFA